MGHRSRMLRRGALAIAALAGQLADAHRREREPHVKRLAELHQRIMSETLYRQTLH